MTMEEAKKIGERKGFEEAKKKILARFADVSEDVFAKFAEEIENVPLGR